MQNKKFGSLTSSVNPEELSATIQGLLKVAGGLLAYFGYSQITGGDITSVSDQIGTVVTLGYTFFGAVESLFGIIRKIVVVIQQRNA